ncbi:IclR family transcriptional regulator [Dactylosporangium sp. NPDC048998]|uniref:IclR family transcriptional regulator n=1 Tax=Dactylosporangium sp. NPDC048998 TaxID=3363976 RepID=UPI003711F6EB
MEGSIKSAERVLRILHLVAGHREGLAAADIRARLDLPKSSLHGLLQVMTEHSYLALEPRTRSYRVGIRAWEVGQAYSRTQDLVTAARPILRVLRDELDETIQMATLDGLDNVYIAKEESAQPLRLVSDVGLRLPAHTTALGKVLLAGLPGHQVRARLAGVRLQRFTEATISDKSELLRRLALVRTRGYGEDDGEYMVGLYCVAVPVRTAAGAAPAAISCSIPVARAGTGPERAQRYLPALRAAAAQIATALPAGP